MPCPPKLLGNNNLSLPARWFWTLHCKVCKAISRAHMQSCWKQVGADSCWLWWLERQQTARVAFWCPASLALPKMETASKWGNRFGFFQFILHGLGELEKYSLLRIRTLAHLLLQLYSPSSQVDLVKRIQSHSELHLAKIISLTLHASGKH